MDYKSNSEEPFTSIYIIYWNELNGSYENNTNKQEEVSYKEGKRHGLRPEWYENGKKKSMKDFSEGLQIPLKL